MIGSFSRIILVSVAIAILIVLASGLSDANQRSARDSVTWVTSTGEKINPLKSVKQAVVLIFVMTDCPISNRYAPEIRRMADQYTAKGIAFHLVYADPDVSAQAVQTHRAEFSLSCNAILDPKHTLAKRLGATVSPEAVVVGPKEAILYRGRIDDRAVSHGKKRAQATREDLRLALDSILKGKKVAVPRTKAVGCIL